MKSPVALSPAAKIAVAALVILGLLGGSLIVAHAGFETSPRRGGSSTFVPAPQAYFLAATMYGMSVIGLLALLQQRKLAMGANVFAVLVYALVAALLATILAP